MPAHDYYFPSRQLVSQQDAAINEPPVVPRSRFTGSWSRKMTLDAAYLYPFMLEEVLPGDHLTYNVQAYVRLSTPLFPIFDQQRIDTFFFFVPNRLVWDNWERFMGAQDNPADSIGFTIPQIVSPASGFPVNNIYDHMGVPVLGQQGGGTTITVNALPFRAWNLIYNTWFRDQNLINSVPVNKASNGPDTSTDYSLLRRAKSHDYFTSCLPWTQKFTAPTIPLSGQASVKGLGVPAGTVGVADGRSILVTPLATQVFANSFDEATGGKLVALATGAGAGVYPNIYADLSTVSGITINTFRQSFMLQSLLERDARGGTRYTELLQQHFGVHNPDGRLQRPEYIGGGQTPLSVTPVAQTAPVAGVSPLGALGGAGAASGSHRASFAATEHGFIIGIINIRTELSYQQGLPRMFSRSTRYDYYWPSLAQLGEQAVLQKEIYISGAPSNDDLVFGYQERWHEYRTRYSEVTGMFRSTTGSNIDEWHLAQQFTAAPTLGATFINDTPPVARVLAAGSSADNMQYLAYINIQRTAVRPIPTFGTPALLGRF